MECSVSDVIVSVINTEKGCVEAEITVHFNQTYFTSQLVQQETRERSPLELLLKCSQQYKVKPGNIRAKQLSETFFTW